MNQAADPPLARAAPPALQYADTPARMGIIYGPTPDGFKMTIQLPVWRRIVAAAMGIPLILFFIAGWFVAIVALIVVLIIGLLRRSFHKPLEIEIDRHYVIFRNLERNSPDYKAPRTDVYDVRYVKHSRQIVVHAHHQQMVEMRPVKDPKVLEWIAKQIREALWGQQSETAP